MKGDVGVLFFNGITKRSTVDVRIAGRVSLAPDSTSTLLRPSAEVFSEAATSLAVSTCGRVLETVLGGDGWQRLSFRADSLKLEELLTHKAVPDLFHVAQLLAASILVSMLSDINASMVEDDKPLLCDARNEDDLHKFTFEKFSARLMEHANVLRESFSKRRAKEPHPLLQRAKAMEDDGTPDLALKLLETLPPEQLEPSDYGMWCILKLKATTRLDLTDPGFHPNMEQYNAMCLKNRHDSEVLRALAFVWIRYLQNRRDFPEALKEVKRFDSEFPESHLAPSEKAVFSYIKGRSEYHQGEYIGALELLDAAFSRTEATDLEFRSDILNTAASSFTDNLFFDHADQLLSEALRIREQLGLAKKVETLSAMGCVALKKAHFEKACELFDQTLREMQKNGFIEEENRILNYAAKGLIYKGDFAKASDLIEEALRKAGEKKRDVAFSNSIKMSFLVKKENFADADAFFRETFLLPENHSEISATAWGYFFEAEACYRLGRKRDALQYQARSIKFFLSDRYVLEAGLGGIAPLLWDISEEEMSFFEKLIGDTDLLSILMNYKETHRDLPERFFKKFFDNKKKNTGASKSQLEIFIENIVNAAVTKSPKKAQSIFNSICLL